MRILENHPNLLKYKHFFYKSSHKAKLKKPFLFVLLDIFTSVMVFLVSDLCDLHDNGKKMKNNC